MYQDIFVSWGFEGGVSRASLVHELETTTRPKSHMRQGGSMQDFLQLPPCLLHIFPLPKAFLHLSTSNCQLYENTFTSFHYLLAYSQHLGWILGFLVPFFLISSSPSQSIFSFTYRIANWNLKLRKKIKKKNQNLKEKIAWSQLFGLYKAPRNNFSILSFLPRKDLFYPTPTHH